MYDDQDLHKAQFLIERNYISNIDVIQLAKNIYNERKKQESLLKPPIND